MYLLATNTQCTLFHLFIDEQLQFLFYTHFFKKLVPILLVSHPWPTCTNLAFPFSLKLNKKIWILHNEAYRVLHFSGCENCLLLPPKVMFLFCNQDLVPLHIINLYFILLSPNIYIVIVYCSFCRFCGHMQKVWHWILEKVNDQ